MQCFARHGHRVTVLCPLQRREGKSTSLATIQGIEVLAVRTLNITGRCSLIEKGIATMLVGRQFFCAVRKYFGNKSIDLILYVTPPVTIAPDDMRLNLQSRYPELFRSARPKDPLKSKQLHQGLKELGEEGAIQVFEGEFGNLMLGAVGQLQFENVAQRLATEYKVDALYEGVDVSTARWLVFPDEETKKEFCNEQRNRLAKDSEGNLCYMASSIYNLQTTMKHWPKVEFESTREQGQRFES